jgi:hypothetical protein
MKKVILMLTLLLVMAVPVMVMADEPAPSEVSYELIQEKVQGKTFHVNFFDTDFELQFSEQFPLIPGNNKPQGIARYLIDGELYDTYYYECTPSTVTVRATGAGNPIVFYFVVNDHHMIAVDPYTVVLEHVYSTSDEPVDLGGSVESE